LRIGAGRRSRLVPVVVYARDEVAGRTLASRAGRRFYGEKFTGLA